MKNFLAKLLSWNSERNRQWQNSAARRFQEENERERNLARERQEIQRHNMQERPGKEPVITERAQEKTEQAA